MAINANSCIDSQRTDIIELSVPVVTNVSDIGMQTQLMIKMVHSDDVKDGP